MLNKIQKRLCLERKLTFQRVSDFYLYNVVWDTALFFILYKTPVHSFKACT